MSGMGNDRRDRTGGLFGKTIISANAALPANRVYTDDIKYKRRKVGRGKRTDRKDRTTKTSVQSKKKKIIPLTAAQKTRQEILARYHKLKNKKLRPNIMTTKSSL